MNALQSRNIDTGLGLTGGGDLTSDRTLDELIFQIQLLFQILVVHLLKIVVFQQELLPKKPMLIIYKITNN